MDSRKEAEKEVSPGSLQRLVETMPEYAMVVLDLSGFQREGRNGE